MEEGGFDMQCGIDSSSVPLVPMIGICYANGVPVSNIRSLVLAIFLQWLGLFRQLGFVA